MRHVAILAVGIILGILIGALVWSSPRPASGRAPTPSAGAGYEWRPLPAATRGPARTSATTPPSPTPAPSDLAMRRELVRVAPPTAKPSAGHRLRGKATWYAANGQVAAAGPALRRALGKGWRGRTVTVCADGRCVRVVLSDWCACGPRGGVPTLLDLSDGAFARLAPLSAGVIRVTVQP